MESEINILLRFTLSNACSWLLSHSATRLPVRTGPGQLVVQLGAGGDVVPVHSTTVQSRQVSYSARLKVVMLVGIWKSATAVAMSMVDGKGPLGRSEAHCFTLLASLCI